MVYMSLINSSNIKNITLQEKENMIHNYLEGCVFIFDLYICNTIKNYKWHYMYEESPTLTDISNYMNKHNNMVSIQYFDSAKYFDVNSYIQYTNNYKKKIILELIHKIHKRHDKHMNKRTIIDEKDIDNLKVKYLTYDNVRYLFDSCNGKSYFNKCLEITNPPNIK